MQRWQQLGYDSYGAWRRATEKARQQTRRAALKAPQLHPSWNFSPLPAPPQPSVVQHATVQSAAQSDAVQSAAAPFACLPGRLEEQVLVTPNGRRRHKFQHTSPGGTSRVDEYVSPADGQHQHGRRLECLHRLAAARRTETRVRVFGCGTCEACKEYAQSRALACLRNGERMPLDAMGPRELKRSRSKYQICVSC